MRKLLAVVAVLLAGCSNPVGVQESARFSIEWANLSGNILVTTSHDGESSDFQVDSTAGTNWMSAPMYDTLDGVSITATGTGNVSGSFLRVSIVTNGTILYTGIDTGSGPLSASTSN